jgi:predicted RNA-binding protein with PUA domain
MPPGKEPSMSHFLRIQTQIREREHLAAALRDLHYQFREGENLVVRGFSGNRERAEVVVDTGCQYDIGFQKKAEQFEVVADWWGVEGNSRIRQKQFIQQVNRQYAYNLIRAQAREQDLIIEEEQELANGDRVIVLSERG